MLCVVCTHTLHTSRLEIPRNKTRYESRRHKHHDDEKEVPQQNNPNSVLQRAFSGSTTLTPSTGEHERAGEDYKSMYLVKQKKHIVYLLL